MNMGGNEISNIDPRLWAYLRILYSKEESDLTKHGYNPFSVQKPGSVVSAEIETQVVKTLIGIVGIILREYGSDVESDLRELRDHENDNEGQIPDVEEINSITASSDDIVKDVHRILWNVLNSNAYTPPTPFTVRRSSGVNLNKNVKDTDNNEVTSSDSGSFRDGIASANSPYRIAVANTPGSKPGVGSNSPAEAILLSADNRNKKVQNIDNDIQIKEKIEKINESGNSDENENENLDGEGSLEDIIARSTSSIPLKMTGLPPANSSLPPQSLLKENVKNEDMVGNDGKIEETVKSDSYNSGSINSERIDLLEDLNSMGMGLPINVREALRYRIRKKLSFITLVRTLNDIHKTHQDSIEPSVLDTLLPPVADIDKGERRKKIRELVDEVRNRPSKDDLLITANKISSKWAERGLSL